MSRYALAMFGLVGLTVAQTQFVKMVGTADYDWGLSVVQTQDKGFMVAGTTSNLNYGPVILCRFDSLGNYLWTRKIDGIGVGAPGMGVRNFLIATSDGGFAIAGWMGGTPDIVLVKLDGNGNLQWARTIGGTGNDYGCGLVQTTDGGFAVTGYAESWGVSSLQDLVLTKFDASGNHLWTTVLENPGGILVRGYAVILTPDKGFAVAGVTTVGAATTDALLVRLDSLGNYQWNRTLNGGSWDYGHSLVRVSDGGFVVGGYSYLSSFYKLTLSKFDATGNYLWTRSMDQTQGGDGLTATTDGGCVIAGYLDKGGGNLDLLLSKFDASGTHLWSWASGDSSSLGYSVIQTSDGGFAATGQTASFGAGGGCDIILTRHDASGGTTCIGGAASPTVNSTGLVLTTPALSPLFPSPTVTTITPTITNLTMTDTSICIWPLWAEEETSGSNPCLRAEGNFLRFTLPTAGDVQLSVYDPVGRLVARPFDGWVEAGEHELGLDLDGGVYLAVLRYQARTQTAKMVR